MTPKHLEKGAWTQWHREGANGADRPDIIQEGAAKVRVIFVKMGVIRGIRHLTTFEGGKIAVSPGHR